MEGLPWVHAVSQAALEAFEPLGAWNLEISGQDAVRMNPAATEDRSLPLARELSPRRSTSTAKDVEELVAEQLSHFSIDPSTALGQTLSRLTRHIYQANIELHQLWELTTRELA